MIKYLRSNPLTPFMISLPHSGQFYPEEFIKYKTINLKELKIMEDVKSNKLIDKINKKHADILIAECSRPVLDLNRSKFSIDNDMFSDFCHNSAPRSSFDTLLGRDKSYKSPTHIPTLQDR